MEQIEAELKRQTETANRLGEQFHNAARKAGEEGAREAGAAAGAQLTGALGKGFSTLLPLGTAFGGYIKTKRKKLKRIKKLKRTKKLSI
jgi:hypothetical protein